MKLFPKFLLGSFFFILACAHSEKIPDEVRSFKPTNLNLVCESSVEGTMKEGFASPTTTGDVPCPTAYQTCMNGKWMGPPLFATCENYTKNCGTTLHGGIEVGFLQSVGSHESPCIRAQRTCVNGSWSGPTVVPTCFEN